MKRCCLCEKGVAINSRHLGLQSLGCMYLYLFPPFGTVGEINNNKEVWILTTLFGLHGG